MDSERRLRSNIRNIFSASDSELDDNVASEVENEVLALMRDYTHAPPTERDLIYSAGEDRILSLLRGENEPGWTHFVNEKISPIPAGFHSITPYLIINGAADALEFYKRAFGATELFRMDHKGKIGHAEIKIGDSPIMLADEYPEMGYLSPATLGGTPVSILLYVDDVDTIFNQALSAGGEVQIPLENQFYGDRMGTLRDPFGHVWHVATHVEDVSPEEIDRRIESKQARTAENGA